MDIIEGVTKRSEGGQPHNKNRMLWPTPEDRIAACQRYCDYLKMGKPKEYYPEASPATISSYMKNYPVEFDTEAIEASERAGRDRLLSIGYSGMLGKIPGFNARTWQFIVQNMTHFKMRTDVTTDGQKIEAPMVFIPEEKNDA